MKAVIVNCFDTYEDRVDLIHEYFKGKKYEVVVLQSDFRHFKKVQREQPKEGFIFIKARPYYKNLSTARLFSHYKYSKDAFKIVEDIKPDLLYVLVPPNSLVKFAAKYKLKNKEVKLVFDVIDLWPETMPIGKLKKSLPFILWRKIRDNSLKYANLVITECNLYQTVLSETLKNVNTETVYLAKKEIDVISRPQLGEDEIHLAYLGSINNIIDIAKISEIIRVIKEVKPVTLHIIGNGESKKELIDAAQLSGANVEFHGKLYDSQEKQNIFDKCHFGINVMKESVCVGLTMKSIDYFQHGLPIINNIPADTAEIVEKYGAGINILDSSPEESLQLISNISVDKNKQMRAASYNVFESLFSKESFVKNLNSKSL